MVSYLFSKNVKYLVSVTEIIPKRNISKPNDFDQC